MSRRNTTTEATSARRAWVEQHMGMPVSIHLRGDGIDSDQASRAVGAAFETLPGVSWCINAGGDLRVGAHPDMPRRGEGAIVWNVGIEDPADRTRLVGALALIEGAVATSGTYARGAHLYDPDGATMIERPGSVTVTGPTLL